MGNERERNLEAIAVSTWYALLTLLDGQKFGMEIWKEIREMSDGRAGGQTPNNMYNILGRCVKNGLIDIAGCGSNRGGTGNYYQLTDRGREYLDEAEALMGMMNRDLAELKARHGLLKR
jgi:DNA-binding PadR family transcriptional regulator